MELSGGRSKCPRGMRKDTRKGRSGCRSNKSRSIRRFLRKNRSQESRDSSLARHHDNIHRYIRRKRCPREEHKVKASRAPGYIPGFIYCTTKRSARALNR